jgi:hypothetical protein
MKVGILPKKKNAATAAVMVNIWQKRYFTADTAPNAIASTKAGFNKLDLFFAKLITLTRFVLFCRKVADNLLTSPQK